MSQVPRQECDGLRLGCSRAVQDKLGQTLGYLGANLRQKALQAGDVLLNLGPRVLSRIGRHCIRVLQGRLQEEMDVQQAKVGGFKQRFEAGHSLDTCWRPAAGVAGHVAWDNVMQAGRHGLGISTQAGSRPNRSLHGLAEWTARESSQCCLGGSKRLLRF